MGRLHEKDICNGLNYKKLDYLFEIDSNCLFYVDWQGILNLEPKATIYKFGKYIHIDYNIISYKQLIILQSQEVF